MTGRVYVANTTHHVEVDGVPTIVRKDQRVREGHGLLKMNPQYFTAIEDMPTLGEAVATDNNDAGAAELPEGLERETLDYLESMAAGRGVDVGDVEGTGPGGRVTKRDLITAMGGVVSDE
jgi:pyruvate/2-oxoglutarate dehydrogenase complex dihydrolipoamide acyltransferase (E2) component